MKSLRINWLYKILAPGYLFLFGLLLAITSIWIFQATTFWQLLVGVCFISYGVFLILLKYTDLKHVTIISLLIFTLVSFCQRKETNSLDLSHPLIIYPDQLNIKEDFVSGVAHSNKRQVLVNMPLTPKLKAALSKEETLIINNLNGEKSRIEPATNLGQFDYRKYYAGQRIYEKLTLKNYDFNYKRQTLIDYFHALRFKIKKYCSSLPQLLGFMTSEMILAENSNNQTKSVLDNYRDLGVIHLLSISGLHVGLYTSFISIICTLLKRNEFETLIICSCFLGLEIFLSDFQPGFVRASLGFILGELFCLFKVPISSGDKLGIVAIIHLFFQPRLFFNCGAILSYLLVLGLEFVGKKGPVIQGFLLNLLISPILLANFYRVNVLTVIFNLLIVPVFNFILLPLTFIGALTYKWLTPLAMLVETIFKFIMNLTGFLAHTKLGMITYGKITWWQTVILLGMTAYIMIIDKRGSHRKNYFFLGLMYIGIFASIHFPLVGQVSLIDVGQGDSILITTPVKRRVYLIDTGGKLNFGRKKLEPQIKRVTIPYLYAQGIDHLDGVFLSHQDADHIGDLGPLLEQMSVKHLYFAQGLTKNPSFLKRIAGRIKYTKLVPLLAGDVVKDGGMTFNVVFPFEPGEGKNEDSLSLWFGMGQRNWLFTGDLDQEGEKKLINNFPVKIDYFKLGHHGSKTSSNPEFMAKLKPKIVFISAGRNNRFGHPHQETLQTLSNLQIPYYTTQDSGTITWTYSPFTQKEKFKTYNQGLLHGTN